MREFYVQFFENVIRTPITSITYDSGVDANLLYRRSWKRWPLPVRALVRRFQRLCKIYFELLGEQYESSDVVADFQREFVVEMLDEISAWAEDAGLTGICDRATASHDSLQTAISEVS